MFLIVCFCVLTLNLFQTEHLEAMPGYLSLHQNPEGLIIKWTPNQLMNGCYGIGDCSSDSSLTSQDKRFVDIFH